MPATRLADATHGSPAMMQSASAPDRFPAPVVRSWIARSAPTSVSR